MSKLKVVYYGAVDTYSGYGSSARDKIRSLLNVYGEEWDIRIISCNWGNTPSGFITDNSEEWGFLNDLIAPNNQIHYQPDIMIWHTIPPEAKPVGKFNCLITAGIETNACAADWIEGVNRMDLTIVSSNHSKEVFTGTQYEKRNKDTQALEGYIKLEKPVEVVFEGVDIDIFKPIKDGFKNKELYQTIKDIPESFAYIFTSMWVGNAPVGEDRKNVSLLIKAFYETFKNKRQKPCLILKTTTVGASYMDREEILKRIKAIKKTVNSKDLPNIYLLHGEFTDNEMNELYNHPKIKAMVNLTKGEGFGRTLLEFSLTQKPIITSAWSGPVDFLDPKLSCLVGGNITPIHPQSSNQWLIPESSWFSPDHGQVGFFLKDVFEKYSKYQTNAKRQAFRSKSQFNTQKMEEILKDVFTKYLPEFPKEIKLNLPNFDSIKLPPKPQLQQI